MNKFAFIYVAVSLLSLPLTLYAQETQNQAEENSQNQEEEGSSQLDIWRLDTVEIFGKVNDSGNITLDKNLIELAPNFTNSINDLLRGQSSIQFDSTSRNSLLGGEITPPKISIFGAKHYENNFMINGVGNNSYINPEGFNPTQGMGGGQDQITSDSQALIISPDLVDRVEVYTENVPAKYGDFVGGVIDSKLRDAGNSWHVNANYKYTGNGMSQLHYLDGQEDEIAITGGGFQPDFNKHNASFSFDGPIIKDTLGIVAAYNTTRSFIPQHLAIQNNKEVTEKRTNENYMLHLNTLNNEKFYLGFTTIYAPYQATYYQPNFKDGGEYEVNGGGLYLMLNSEYNFSFGQWKNDFAYIFTEATANAEGNTVYNWGESSVLDWATLEDQILWPWNPTISPINYRNWDGTFPDSTMTQDMYTWNSLLELNTIGTNFLHDIYLGFNLSYIAAKSSEGAGEYYADPMKDPTATGSYEDGVVAGEQYAQSKIVYDEQSNEENFTKFAFFIEDEMTWKNLTFRAGLRMSYDTLMENFDIAPRLFANYDIMGDGLYNINAGYNRYYGSQVLERALRIAREYTPYTRTSSTDPWVSGGLVAPSVYSDFTKLKNPYTDELAFGASANIADAEFKVRGIYRKYDDQLAGDIIDVDGNSVFVYSNEGETEYLGLTLSVEKSFDLGKFGKHNIGLSATFSETKSGSFDWTNGAFSENPKDEVSSGPPFWTALPTDLDNIYLDGKLVSAHSVPANNFNSPLIISYIHNANFFDDDLRIFAQVRYEQGGDRVITASPSAVLNPENNLYTYSYTTEEQNDAFYTDISIDYDMLEYKNSVLTLEFDVYNLFDNKNISNVSTSQSVTGSYSMGRQMYLGLRYTY